MGETKISGFGTELIRKSFIRAPQSDTVKVPSVLTVTNFDRLSGRYPVTLFYAYQRPLVGDFDDIVSALKASLSDVLAFFPLFAGRVVSDPESGDPEILCNNAGVELIEALVDVPLAALEFYNLDRSVKKTLLPFDHQIPLSLQVTGYACGGFSVAWSFDHLLADGAGFFRFLASWSEIARTKKISTVPNHDRSTFQQWLALSGQPTEGHNPSPLDRVFARCTLKEILACPSTNTNKRLYYIEGSCIERLRAMSSDGGGRRTKTEAVSAHLWKILARSVTNEPTCKMGWLVDGRPRIKSGNSNLSSYIGNIVSMAAGEASTAELNEGSIAQVAGIVSKAIGEAANEGHFVELDGWIEAHRSGSGLVLARILLGLEGPGIVVSSCHNMPVMETDFGFGAPLLGTFYTTLETLGAGYVSFFPSGKSDGSWLVFAFVSPRLEAEIQSDPDRVFQPITLAHLGMGISF